MPNKLAAQLYTVRDLTKTPEGLETVLAVCHMIGYAGVQLSAVGCMNGDSPEVDAKRAKDMLDENGLVCCATHRPWDRLRDFTDDEIVFHKTLGCDYVAVGGVWPKESSGFAKFARDARPVVKALNSAGIRFGYHNHDHEFAREPASGKTYYELIAEDGGPELMLEVDTYWVAHAGVDPVSLLARYATRIPVIHVKDKEVVSGAGPVMAPVGEGNLDWPKIVEVCERGGVEWYVVEQDTCRRDPFDCLRSSYEYLSTLLEGV